MTPYQQYYAENRERLLAQKAEYYRANKEKVLARAKAAYKRNKDALYKANRRWVEANTELVKEYRKEYQKNNRQRFRVYGQKFYCLNKERLNYERMNRYRNDELFRVMLQMTTKIRKGVLRAARFNSTKIIEHLGCSYKQLREHIERQFSDGMSWENRSRWHIDHITPMSSAKTVEEIYPLFHWTNLRPLWAHDNLSKWAKIPNRSELLAAA